MAKTLFVSDLDGTLLGPDSKVSAESRRFLNEAIRHGALFSVATARTPATVSSLLDGINIQLPAVVMTGSVLWNRSTGEYTRVRPLNPEDAHAVLDTYRRHGVPVFCYVIENDLLTVYHQSKLSELEKSFVDPRSHTPYKRFAEGDATELLAEAPLRNVLLLYSMQPTGPSKIVYDEIRRLRGINTLLYHDIFGPEVALTETFSADVNKAAAIEALKKQCGADRVVVFGDNLNDLPMMRSADVAVAVGNALDEVKAAAHVVIGTNRENAVAKFIYEQTMAQS